MLLELTGRISHSLSVQVTDEVSAGCIDYGMEAFSQGIQFNHVSMLIAIFSKLRCVEVQPRRDGSTAVDSTFRQRAVESEPEEGFLSNSESELCPSQFTVQFSLLNCGFHMMISSAYCYSSYCLRGLCVTSEVKSK